MTEKGNAGKKSSVDKMNDGLARKAQMHAKLKESEEAYKEAKRLDEEKQAGYRKVGDKYDPQIEAAREKARELKKEADKMAEAGTVKNVWFRKTGSRELEMLDDFVEVKELRRMEEPITNQLRVWCSQWPNSFTIQIRAHKATNEYGGGVKRNMIAHFNLTIEEVEELLAYMKSYQVVSDKAEKEEEEQG